MFSIKDNLANIVSISRIFVAFAAVALLFVPSDLTLMLAFWLTAVAFAMDGLDGYIARKFNQSSDLGSVLDIMGDRIVEVTYWVAFAVLGWLNIVFPLICVTRAFVTDSIRSVALSKGFTAFGEKTMQKSDLGKFICASKFMRISYAVAKVGAFMLLILAHIAGCSLCALINLPVIAQILACIAIIFCVIRALPVVFESGDLFKKAENE